jgi:hypothetical protein
LHAAANYAETFIFSVPDSGVLATGHLLNSTFSGPRWLTGGAVGPEASLLEFVVYLAAFFLFSIVCPANAVPADPASSRFAKPQFPAP